MKPKIIIDPGHGGKDLGGGCSQYFTEKDMALKISLFQASLFMDEGIPVVLTRCADVDLPPVKRASVVRDSGAKICISNHINAGGGTGFEIYHSIHAKPTLAQCIADQLAKSNMPARKPPIRTRSLDIGRDYYYMHRDTGSVQTVIVEYGFGDNPEDAWRLHTNWREYARFVVEGVKDYYAKMGWT